MYSEGRGTQADPSAAIPWYRKAAHQGDAKAQYNLGLCYLDGDGVLKNRRLATRWFKEAAATGHKKAARELHKLLKDTR
jgi:TPR repeat protein